MNEEQIMTTNTEKRHRAPLDIVTSFFRLVNNVTGLLSIALIILKGGAFLEKLNGIERRVGIIEQSGSSRLQFHEGQDDERIAALRESLREHGIRLARQDEMVAKLMELGGEVKVINAKLDSLKEQLAGKVRP